MYKKRNLMLIVGVLLAMCFAFVTMSFAEPAGSDTASPSSDTSDTAESGSMNSMPSDNADDKKSESVTDNEQSGSAAVSYTHLTLPTICSV